MAARSAHGGLSRTLRYPGDWPEKKAEEKGVDVALAVDFVTMAVNGLYDIGVLVSSDTDLLPALEAVLGLPSGSPTPEVAAWQPDDRPGYRLRVPGGQVRCNWLDRNDFLAAADSRDYNIVTRAGGG